LRKKKLFTKPEKCEFWLRELKFLGHVISQEGVSIYPDKVSVVSFKEFETYEKT